MNLKIVLAAVVLMSAGSGASYAQSKPSSAATVQVARAFEKKVSAYEKETDATKSAGLLESLKQEMTEGIAAAKTEIANQSTKGNKDAAGKWMKKYETRSQSYNDLLQKNADKAAVVSSLKKYAGTL